MEYDSEPTIIIDVNDSKKPNTLGKDVFLLQFSEDKGVVPYCQTYNKIKINGNCKKGGSGNYCLKRIMSNSWEYDDYPL